MWILSLMRHFEISINNGRSEKKMKHLIVNKVISSPSVVYIKSFFTEVIGGYRIYKSLIRTYGKDTKFLMCSPRGTGDIYIIGLYLDYYLEKNGIDKYTFLFRGNSEKKVGRLFGILGDTILDEWQIWKLNRFLQVYGMENTQCIELHHHMYPEQSHAYSQAFEGLNGWTFRQLFTRVGMNIQEDTYTSKPRFRDNANISKLFERKKLIPGRTVILSPYSSSATMLEKEWWEELVKQITEYGLSVATNVGSYFEKPIKGSVALEIPYENIKQYLEYAGFFVGSRSGLCDIVSSSDCLKIVLTPFWGKNLPWGNRPRKSFLFYNMNANYPDANFIEYEYDELNANDIQKKVLNDIKENKKKKYEEGIVEEPIIISNRSGNSAIVYIVEPHTYSLFRNVMGNKIKSIKDDEEIIVFMLGLSPKQEQKIRTIAKKESKIRCFPGEKYVAKWQAKYTELYDRKEALLLLMQYITKLYKKLIYLPLTNKKSKEEIKFDECANNDYAVCGKYILKGNKAKKFKELVLLMIFPENGCKLATEDELIQSYLFNRENRIIESFSNVYEDYSYFAVKG